MESIMEIVKGQKPYSVDEQRTVLDVARLMVEHNIGAVAVCRGEQLVGIFSERDLLRRVVAEMHDPARTLVSEVMTRDPISVAPQESFDNCSRMMKEHNFRHLPVCDAGRLVGMLSIRDIMVHDLAEKDGELQFIRGYVQQAS